MSPDTRPYSPDIRTVYEAWWPLACSWLLMGLELPAVSALMARLADPEINLAAYGGVVFPISLLIEAPIIMLLAASTALSKTWSSYVVLRRFMIQAAAVLTALHVLVAFTPLFDLVVGDLLGAPPEIHDSARIGLMLMTPWTASIAVRRFQQGVMIRRGRSRAIGAGTAIRLLSNILVLILGYWIGTIPGIAVATTAVSIGVIAEAFYIKWRVNPLLSKMRHEPVTGEASLTTRTLLSFYGPLAVTPVLTLAALPLLSAALSRMPHPIESLAVWPVLSGLVFSLRSVGLAYNEVVVSMIERPGAAPILRRFAGYLACGTSGLLLLIAASPMSEVWFAGVAGLSPSLTALGASALWLVLPLPAFSAVESWYQGIIVYSRLTRGVTESVTIYLLTYTSVLTMGILYADITGLYVGLIAVVTGLLCQTFWLWLRSRPAREALLIRDHVAVEGNP